MAAPMSLAYFDCKSYLANQAFVTCAMQAVKAGVLLLSTRDLISLLHQVLVIKPGTGVI